MVTPQNSGQLAIYRRSDEMNFLQHRLRALQAAYQATQNKNARADFGFQRAALMRERDLADELVHTRQVEPLGETLQRRLAMAERICRDLAGRGPEDQGYRPDACRLAEIDRQALAEMLKQWWVWLRRP